MASKVSFWHVVGVTAGLASALILYGTHQKMRSRRRKFCIVEADESSGSLEVDSPLPGNWTALGLEQPLVIAMSGLPARGKSYVVKMIMRYLRWTGFECKLFNVGSYRRKMGLGAADSTFFSAGNSDGTRMREELAMAVQESMYEWLHEGNNSTSAKRRVAIFDATNTTISRRLILAQKARKENVYLLFVESICDDASVLAQNYAVSEILIDHSGIILREQTNKKTYVIIGMRSSSEYTQKFHALTALYCQLHSKHQTKNSNIAPV